MYSSTVVIEDKNGDEHRGKTTTTWPVKEDQLVTVQIHNGRYVSGFVLEILGEEHESGGKI